MTGLGLALAGIHYSGKSFLKLQLNLTEFRGSFVICGHVCQSLTCGTVASAKFSSWALGVARVRVTAHFLISIFDFTKLMKTHE